MLTAVRRTDTRITFVTNNASRTPHAVADHVRRLGVPAEAAEVATSAQAAARLIAERVPARSAVLVVGGMGLRQAVRARALRPVTTAAQRPVAVVQGYDPGLGYDDLAEATLAVRAGALYVAANADVTLPTARGILPGNGAFVQAVRAATGSDPLVAGKPEPSLYDEATSRAGAVRPLMVGDRLETDIEGAVHAGVDSLLVLTGVTGPLDLVLAPPSRRPTYVAADLGGLLDCHPAVHRDGDAWVCRGWVARGREGRFGVEGHGDPCDGLRALCGAVWHAVGTVREDAVYDAVARLTDLRRR